MQSKCGKCQQTFQIDEKQITDESVIVACPSCGQKNRVAIPKKTAQPVMPVAVSPASAGPVAVSIPKNKKSAMWLAVLLGSWTWLYTYRRDAWKFWVNLGIGLIVVILGITIGGIIGWIWAIIDTAGKPNEWYQKYPNG